MDNPTLKLLAVTCPFNWIKIELVIRGNEGNVKLDTFATFATIIQFM